MKYKLLALDVDGTLINDDYQITAQTIETIKAVYETGCKIVLCTGRGFQNTKPIMDQLGLEGVIVTHNGAATVLSMERRVIHQYPFAIEEIADIIEYCREKKMHFDACTAYDIHMESISEEEAEEYKKLMITPTVIQDIMLLGQPIVKLSVFAPEALLNQAQIDWVQDQDTLQTIRSGENFLDVMQTSANKGNALRALARHWRIKAAEIIAIGNYYNDLEMIRFAGLGIAMDNSPQEVKDQSDALTASNNEEGVHRALQKYYFSS